MPCEANWPLLALQEEGVSRSMEAKGSTHPTVGLNMHFGVPLNSVHLNTRLLLGSSNACPVCLGLGGLWAQQAWHGLCMTCHNTCLGIFSTLDSNSPTRVWFKSCFQRPVLGLHSGRSQQHVAKDRAVLGWRVRSQLVCLGLAP